MGMKDSLEKQSIIPTSKKILVYGIVKRSTFILENTFIFGLEKIQEIITKTAEPKHLRSQNYPENYPPNEDREWIFNQTTGQWAMTINDFQLEDSQQCQNDYLLIRRSNSKSV